MIIESKYTVITWDQPGKWRGGRGANTSKLEVSEVPKMKCKRNANRVIPHRLATPKLKLINGGQ